MFLRHHILKDPRENFLGRKLFYWMQLHYSRRLFKQTLFQQSRRPHLQVQEGICYTPETCVMCQLWRAACGKGRPHPQCGLPTFLLIYHKWNFQWLAGTSPSYQITSKRHLLAHYSSLEAWPLKSLTVSIQEQMACHGDGCWGFGNSQHLPLVRHGIIFLYFGLIVEN